MKTKPTQFCALAAFVALLGAGYGAPSSFDFSGPIDPSPAADRAPILLAVNESFGRIMAIPLTFIQHDATERQKKIAQMHAVAFIKHLAPQKKEEMKKKKIHYIAVDTERSAQTDPRAKEVVMVWDTQSESLVGNSVYELPNPPPVGVTAKFDTYAAEYVGGH